jgi:uncharacterized protein
MRYLLLWLLKTYRLLSPLKGPSSCRFLPTCSDYAVQAVQVHGARKGSWLTLTRLCRCHPLGGSGVDEVPRLIDACVLPQPASAPTSPEPEV